MILNISVKWGHSTKKFNSKIKWKMKLIVTRWIFNGLIMKFNEFSNQTKENKKACYWWYAKALIYQNV